MHKDLFLDCCLQEFLSFFVKALTLSFDPCCALSFMNAAKATAFLAAKVTNHAVDGRAAQKE